MTRSRFWRFIHNVIAHPMLELLPKAWATWFHDKTARLAWGEETE